MQLVPVPSRLTKVLRIANLNPSNVSLFSSSNISLKGPARSPRVKQARARPNLTPPPNQRKPDLVTEDASLGTRAVALQGSKLEQVGKVFEALQLYEKAIDSYHGEAYDRLLLHEPSQHESVARVFLSLARVRAKSGDWVGTEKAITAAALEHDDPTAYFILAAAFRQGDMPDFELYLSKAAASGILFAAYELGILHLNRYKQRVTPSPANALEWLGIGAEAGITASQLYFAILLREVGQVGKGLEWLEKASTSKKAHEWATAIKFTRSVWQLGTPDLLYSRIEEIRKNSEGYPMGRAMNLSHIARLTISEHTGDLVL